MKVPNRALYPLAKEILINLQKLDPDNEDVKKLLKKMQ